MNPKKSQKIDEEKEFQELVNGIQEETWDEEDERIAACEEAFNRRHSIYE